MSTSLYRKYRSRGFDEIVGQRHVTDLLAAAVKNGAISHAYLFTGPRGTGKTSVARILAHAINKLPYTYDSTHLDIIEIDAASNRRIDDIRDLREKVHIAPSSADYKVYIIDEVHMLTGESFNALLKTLEEPPSHVVFVLATTELHKVPATIVSRTQRFHFRPGSIKDITAHLRTIADKEKIAIEDDALKLIAEHSDGGFRDSVSLLDQASSLTKDTITAADIESLIGLAPATSIEHIITAMLAHDSARAITTLQQLIDDGIHPASLTEQLLRYASNQAPTHPELYRFIESLLDISRSYMPKLKLLAAVATFYEPTVNPAPTISNPPAIPVMKAPIAAKPSKEPPAPAKAPEKQPEKTAESAKPAVVSSTVPDDFEWEAVLTKLKKSAPALYSVAKHATATTKDDELVLSFQYALHRNKMKADKQRQALTSVITSLYNTAPVITVADDSPKLDDNTAKVADIMGGGQPITLEKDMS